MSPPGYPSAWVASLQSPTSVSPGEVHCSSVAHDVGDLGWQSIVGGASLVAHLYSRVLIQWVFAVLAFCELAWYALLSPDFLPSPLRVFGKLLVSPIEILINGVPGGLYGSVITVVNDCSSHSAEYRLDYIQELRTGRQRSSF